LYFSAAASFLFFLIVSAPHRVHHFFEQIPSAETARASQIQVHEHGGSTHHSHDNDRNRRSTTQPDCVVLSISQNAHAAIVHTIAFAVLQYAVARDLDGPVVSAWSFNPAPFSQRAPPLV
jgi:hypothetical protein